MSGNCSEHGRIQIMSTFQAMLRLLPIVEGLFSGRSIELTRAVVIKMTELDLQETSLQTHHEKFCQRSCQVRTMFLGRLSTPRIRNLLRHHNRRPIRCPLHRDRLRRLRGVVLSHYPLMDLRRGGRSSNSHSRLYVKESAAGLEKLIMTPTNTFLAVETFLVTAKP